MQIFRAYSADQAMDLEKISDEGTIQFLIENAIKASRQYWTKMNINLLINLGLFAFLASIIADGKDWSVGSSIIGLLISVLGFVLTSIWYNSHVISEYQSMKWIVDARRLAAMDTSGVLINRYLHSLGFANKSEGTDSLQQIPDTELASDLPAFETLKHPKITSSTKPMEYTIVLFFIFWIFFSWVMAYISVQVLIEYLQALTPILERV